MGERRCEFDLSSSGEGDTNTHEASGDHKGPKAECLQRGRIKNDWDLTTKDDERYEEKGREKVIVQGDLPRIVINKGKFLLDIDSVHRHEERRRHAEKHARQRPTHFLLIPEQKAGHDETAACNGWQRRGLSQKHEVKDDVEDNGERAGDLIEADLYIAQAQVVEQDHAREDERERDHLDEDVTAHLPLRHAGDAHHRRDVAESGGDDALEPGDKHGGGGDGRTAKKRLVRENHGERHTPIQGDGAEDLRSRMGR